MTREELCEHLLNAIWSEAIIAGDNNLRAVPVGYLQIAVVYLRSASATEAKIAELHRELTKGPR